ncbi:MAG TPA: HAMP domain-containing sensor histidine kinase [Candidatus Saccharimonadales bacterium]|nr:HAMP domain-containing sensor histidine kinase [Candidatus Saccharimonadales bacterium]
MADATNASLPGDVDTMAYISHELSTPLTAMRWNAELLRLGKMTKPLDAEQQKLVDEILVGVNRMSDLVNDIHESSWLERNKFADGPVPTSLTELVATVQAQQQAAMTAKSLACTVQADPALPPVVARASTLTLIVHNLLSNAVKYTPAGSVTILLRPATAEEAAKAPAPAGASIFLSIADTGMGIPAAEQAQVFQKFFRGSNARAADIEGTGLGLYIVWLALQKLGGAAWFTSAEQQGSTFSVVLPLQREADSVH